MSVLCITETEMQVAGNFLKRIDQALLRHSNANLRHESCSVMNHSASRPSQFYVNSLIDDNSNALPTSSAPIEEIRLTKDEKGRSYKWPRHLRSLPSPSLMEFCPVFSLMHRWQSLQDWVLEHLRTPMCVH